MTLVQHGKKAKSNQDLKLEDLCLTFSIEAMTHWLYSASFLHVKIFLKGLFPGWKDLTAHLSIVSMVKCHSLRSSSCRDQSPSNICNEWMQTCAFWRNILDYKIILVKIRTFWMLCDQTCWPFRVETLNSIADVYVVGHLLAINLNAAALWQIFNGWNNIDINFSRRKW